MVMRRGRAPSPSAPGDAPRAPDGRGGGALTRRAHAHAGAVFLCALREKTQAVLQGAPQAPFSVHAPISQLRGMGCSGFPAVAP